MNISLKNLLYCMVTMKKGNARELLVVERIQKLLPSLANPLRI